MSLRIERDGTLALLRLDKDRGNAIDEPLVEAILRSVETLRQDDGVRGVLLCSAHPKLFCPGLDLLSLESYDAPALTRFMLRFAEMVWALFDLPKPLVAAVSGHAVAGGCILALTADERILRQGASIGLNEVKIGVPLPWTVTTLLRATLPPPSWTEIALAGTNVADDEALRLGIAHAVLPADGFEAACVARLARLADKDPAAFGATKRCLREGALAEMKREEAARAGEFIASWFSPATTERRKQILASLKKS
jgi:enoyl-CoA hydratase/carnithine racemase